MLDASGKVRSGEEIDLRAVDAWLRALVPDLEGEPAVTQYPGGASNWTYRVAYENRDFVLRRPPAGTKAKSAHDMGREYKIQTALKPFYPAVPAMIGLCEDESVIGAPFYVMERVPGVILRRNPPAELRLDERTTRALCLNVVGKLIELHQVDYVAAGLALIAKGPGYPRRQIEGWSDRYEKARTWNVPRFRRVRDWLAANTPADSGTSVIHNDFRFDNVVLDASDVTRVVGVLDWEMATIGDPLMDVGNALAYWVEPGDDPMTKKLRRQPTHLPGMLTRRELVDLYAERTGRKTDNWAFYEVYGLFRLAAIAQQIYYRYHHRQTRNPAFKNFWIFAHYLDWRCKRIIRRSG
jgi:aminoglycoside phosphotransferase (APT) family kinase protein